MFFSRPNIEPLGWDLVSLPTPNGSRNHDAVTSDNKMMDIRFSSGWLIVNYKDLDGSHHLLEKQIAPFGTTDIFPEQICDLLGLTVKGQKIIVPDVNKQGGGRYFDYSGKITHWISSHQMRRLHDVDDFIASLNDYFPQIVLIQVQWDRDLKNQRNRVVDFILDSDDHVLIGIGLDKEIVQKRLQDDAYDKIEFPFLIRFSFGNKSSIPDPIRANKNIKVDVNVVRDCSISATFQTENEEAKFFMGKLLNAIDSYFVGGMTTTVNLETNEIMSEGKNEGYWGSISYSKALLDWCSERDDRYIQVGQLPPNSRENKERIFYGIKPITENYEEPKKRLIDSLLNFLK